MAPELREPGRGGVSAQASSVDREVPSMAEALFKKKKTSGPLIGRVHDHLSRD